MARHAGLGAARLDGTGMDELARFHLVDDDLFDRAAETGHAEVLDAAAVCSVAQ